MAIETGDQAAGGVDDAGEQARLADLNIDDDVALALKVHRGLSIDTRR